VKIVVLLNKFLYLLALVITWLQNFFDLVLSDIWGPAPISSLSSYNYYVCFVDDYSIHMGLSHGKSIWTITNLYWIHKHDLYL